MEVIITKRAFNAIQKITDYYFDELSLPAGAQKLADEIDDFIYLQLTKHHSVYQLCSKSTWKKRNLQCAVFKSQYIVAYKILKNDLHVYHFVHGSKIKESKY